MLYVQCSMVWSLFGGFSKKRLSDLVIDHHERKRSLPFNIKKCKEIFKKSQPPNDSKIQLDSLFDE